MFNNIAVAQHIKKIREERKLTQLYMSYKLKVSQNCYSKIELGHSRVSLERVFEIAELLEVDPISVIIVGVE